MQISQNASHNASPGHSQCTMHPHAHCINASLITPINYSRKCAEEYDDLVILGVTFDSKMTFEKHLRSVSRAASQQLGILRKSWQVFHDMLLLGRCFCFLSCPFWNTALWCGARLTIHTLNSGPRSQ